MLRWSHTVCMSSKNTKHHRLWLSTIKTSVTVDTIYRCCLFPLIRRWLDWPVTAKCHQAIVSVVFMFTRHHLGKPLCHRQISLIAWPDGANHVPGPSMPLAKWKSNFTAYADNYPAYIQTWIPKWLLLSLEIALSLLRRHLHLIDHQQETSTQPATHICAHPASTGWIVHTHDTATRKPPKSSHRKLYGSCAQGPWFSFPGYSLLPVAMVLSLQMSAD